MNRHCHRIIFNRARGLFMAVPEGAACDGKVAGTRPSTPAPRGRGTSAPGFRAVATGIAIAIASACLPGGPANAQIVADPAAPRGQQPTVLLAPNGVPLVNIQTPSDAGVSRNTYRQFDVRQPGAILNNSRTNVQTQLGGWVQGNPWLGRGSARVILNEVNGSAPSYLRGTVEVAGTRTEVVIANPAGIQVDGGAFLNASRVTLTTGTPVFGVGGGLDAYRVQNGTLRIEGRGLDASQTDYADLMARAVEVSGTLQARDLRVAAGASQHAADRSGSLPVEGSGPAATYLLDIQAFGAMYAGHIFLAVDERGAGVRNAGTVAAGTTLTVSADGLLTNTGTLQSRGNAGIAAGQVDNSGRVAASGMLDLRSRDLLRNSGTLEAASLQLASSGGDIDNRGGTLRQTSGSALAIDAREIVNTQGGRIGPELLAATSGEAPPPTDTGTPAPPAPPQPSVPPVQPDPGATPTPPATDLLPDGRIAAAGRLRNEGGNIVSGGAVSLRSDRLDNSGGAAHITRGAVGAGGFANQGGTLTAREGFEADGGSFDNRDGRLQAGQLRIAAQGDILNQSGVLASTGDAQLSSSAGHLDNTRGAIAAGRDLQLEARQLDNGGSLRAGGNARVVVQDLLAQQDDASLTAGHDLTIQAGQLDSGPAGVLGAGVRPDGGLADSGSLRIDTRQALAAHGQNIAAGDLSLQGASIDLSGSRTRAVNIRAVTTAGLLDNRGGRLLGARIELDAARLDNRDAGQILLSASAAGSARITTVDWLDNRGGTIASGAASTTTLSVGGALDNRGGTIATGAAALTTGGVLDNREGTVVTGVATIATGGALDNRGGTLATGAATLAIGGALDNRAGTIATGAARIATAGLLDNRAGTIAADGPLDIASGPLDNDAGLIQSAASLSIDTRGQTLRNTRAGAHASGQGGILAGDALRLTSGRLDNSAGFIGAGERADLRADGIANRDGGILQSQGRLALDAGAGPFDNRHGSLQAVGDLVVHSDAAVDNQSGLMRSGGTLQLQAASLDNRQTAEPQQGIEATDLRLQADLDNRQGALRAGRDAVLSGAGVLNQDGLIAAGRDLSLQSGRFSGDGRLQAGQDLTLAVHDDIVQTGQASATRHLRYRTDGTLTQQGTLRAGADLELQAQDIVNTAGGEITGGAVTRLDAAGSIVNRGLIDGADTRIASGTLQNLGTGRIYGDRVQIAVADLLNDREGAQSATIAARERLDIAVTRTLVNRDGALIFSAGDLAIGGGLDAQGQAIGRAGSVQNAGASIESLGHLSIGAQRLDNLNQGFTVRQADDVAAVNERYYYLDLNLQGARYTPDQLGSCRACHDDRTDNGSNVLVRHEVVRPSERYPFEAGYQRYPYELPGIQGPEPQEPNYQPGYQPADFSAGSAIWRLFDVAYGDFKTSTPACSTTTTT